MDYEKICAMKTKDGEDLVILGGVSVSVTLPFGTPADVKRQIDWLVEKGPRTGLFLGASSTVTPEVAGKRQDPGRRIAYRHMEEINPSFSALPSPNFQREGVMG
jgi:hypothetical protein